MRDGKNCKLAQIVLEVDDPWRHDGQVVHEYKRRVDMHVAHIRGRRHACPNCGAANRPVHDAKPRTWRHPRVGDRQCCIVARVPRVISGECGKVLLAEVPRARPMSRMTRQMEALLVRMSKRSSVRGVALDFDVSDCRIWRAIRHCVEESREKADRFGVRIVGIDETSTCKGHRYIAAVADAMTGKTIHAGPGRDREAVARFAEDLRRHGGCPPAIAKACIVMSAACISGVVEHLPNAAIVHDKFHVVKLVNETVDMVRRAERKIWKVLLKKTRYLLLRNREDPSDANSERVESLPKKEALDRAGLREEGRAAAGLLKRTDPGGGRAGNMEMDRLGAAQQARTLRETEPDLSRAHGRHPRHLRQPRPDQLAERRDSSVIQFAKARARGFMTVENMIAKVYLMTADLDGLPVSPYINIKPSDLATSR